MTVMAQNNSMWLEHYIGSISGLPKKSSIKGKISFIKIIIHVEIKRNIDKQETYT